MNEIISIALALTLIGCSGHHSDWNGGEISESGIYQLYDKSLTVKVDVENDLVRYQLFDGNNKLVIDCPDRISDFQAWQFYLDGERNFWVFSSDIGHCVWRRMLSGNAYVQDKSDSSTNRENVPAEVYQANKHFFYEHIKMERN